MDFEDKKIEGVNVSYSDDGKLLNVEQSKENSLELEILPEGEFKGVTAKVPLVLEDIGVKNGYLVIGNARVDVWAGGDIENEKENLKHLFDCTISGSIAYSSDTVKASKDGIEVTKGGVSIGSLSVENFLGYLNGEGDYLKGFVTLHSEKEKEADASKFLKIGEENLSEGIDVTLPPPIDFLGVKFMVAPTANIGGEIGGTLDRGESFGKPWEQGDPLNFKDGHFNVDGNAKIEASIELLTKAIIAGVGFTLAGNLNANLHGDLKLNTAFAVQEDAGKDKLKQSEDLNFSGNVKADVNAGVTFSGNVIFLFWKKRFFKVEKEKKGIVEAGVTIKGKKSKGKKGLTEGWKVEEGGAFFKTLSKESFKKIVFNQSEAEREAEVDAVLEDAGKETENAWAALAELKRNKGSKEIGVLLPKEEKEKIKTQIDEKKKEVTEKIKKYKKALEKEHTRLGKVIDTAGKDVIAGQALLKETIEKANVPDEFRQKALMGGFREENYKDVSPDMTSVDFIMYKVLGEVSQENLGHIEKRHRNHWKNYSKEEQEKIYHDATSFGETYNYSAVAAYTENASYYRILHKQINFLKTRENPKEIEKNRKEMLKNLNKIVTLQNQNKTLKATLNSEESSKTQTEDTPKSQRKKQTEDKKREKINKQIADNLKQIEILRKTNRMIEGVPSKYRKIIEENPSMTIKELLQIAVTDRYKDQEVHASAKDKEQLLEVCFHSSFESLGALIGDGAYEASDAWLKEMNDIIRDRVRNKQDVLKAQGEKVRRNEKDELNNKLTLKDMVAQASANKTFDLIASGEAKIAARKNDLEKAIAEKQRLEARNAEIEKTIKECEDKLNQMKDAAIGALKEGAFNAELATKAINIYKDDYLGKMKAESDIFEKAGDALEKKLQKETV